MKFYNKIIIIAIFLINSNILLADTEEICIKEPNSFEYNSPDDLLNQDKFKIIENSRCWHVYSIKDNIGIYENEALTKTISHNSSFLDKFKVIRRKEDHPNFFYVSGSSVSGWAKITDFVTLRHAYQDKNRISYKALIVNRVDSVSKDISNSIIARSSPNTSAKQYEEIKVLELPYVYSFYPSIKKPTYVLIGKKSYFVPYQDDENGQNSIKKVILGWVPFERVILWNTREAFEPNTERKYPIYYFKEKKDLVDYYNKEYQNDITPTCDHIPSDDLLSAHQETVKRIESKPCQYYININREALPDAAFRYPIFKDNTPTEKKYKGNLFYIGIPDTKAPSVALNNINNNMPTGRDIVFLIDATRSMEQYIPLVIKIVFKIMEEFKQKTEQFYEQYGKHGNDFHNELRFGIFVYRDPACGTGEFEKIIDLTQRSKKISSALYQINTPPCGDEFGSTYYLESLYLGIGKTIKNVDWNENSLKKIIVIGDAGDIENADQNGDSDNSKKIADLLSDQNISLNAIQIINTPDLSKFDEEKAKLAKQLFKKAQKDFSKDILSIINNFAMNDKKILELPRVRDFFKENYDKYTNEIQDLIAETTYDEKRDDICWKISKDRWSIDCLKVNKDLTKKDKAKFTKKVNDSIKELSHQLYQTRDILEQIKAKNKIVCYEQSNNSYRPEITRSVLMELIKRIGKSKAYNKKKVWSVDQIIEEGAKELDKYLKSDPKFFTKAYALFKHPKKMSEDPNQFIKKIFINKTDLETLHDIVRTILEVYQGVPPTNILVDLWKVLVRKITKEQFDPKQEYSKSIKQYIDIHMGIKLKSEHPFLTYTYKEIEQGKVLKTDFDAFINQLMNCKEKIYNLLYNEKISNKIVYEDYFWINASDLL